MENKAKILICDENNEERTAITRALTASGFFICEEAQDGTRALDMIKSRDYAVIVTDLWLSGIDGVGIIREASSLNSSSKPFLILLSPVNNQAILLEASESGADLCLPKPFDFSTLVYHINSLLRSKNSEKAVQDTAGMHDMEAQVTKIIHQIGIPAHIKGYQYLRTAILMAIDDTDIINSVTKILYPSVAKKYHTSVSKVAWDNSLTSSVSAGDGEDSLSGVKSILIF